MEQMFSLLTQLNSMKNIVILIVFALVTAGLFNACNKEEITKPDPNDPYGVYNPTPFDLLLPGRFPKMIIPDNNPLTVEGVELGKMLYYDPIVHKDSAQACASCHIQELSFSDSSLCMAHVNLGWTRNFLWDGKVTGTLEDVMLFEVDDFFMADINRLNNSATYKKKFHEAFGVKTITSTEAAKALAQFLRTVVSGNSKFDKYVNNTISLSDSEMRGYEIFDSERGDCFHCHDIVLFTDGDFHNNALDTVFTRKGLSDISGNPLDNGKFRTPTLRNIELTAPYMHDGRYNTLEEVVEFYSTGQHYSSTIDPLMYRAAQGGINFTAQEKQDLVAFLKTLTDDDFITNPAFSSPF